MKLNLIIAIASNGLIGKQNSLPWKYPEDLKRFKAITLGHPVIMGRKTFESIGSKPLPGRKNIVISKTWKPTKEESAGFVVCNTIEEAFEVCKYEEKKPFVMGGKEIYRLFYDYVDYAYVTWINKYYEGDNYYMEFRDFIEDMIPVKREFSKEFPEEVSYCEYKLF